MTSTRVHKVTSYTYSETRLGLGEDSIQEYHATVSPFGLHPDVFDEQTRPSGIEFDRASTYITNQHKADYII